MGNVSEVFTENRAIKANPNRPRCKASLAERKLQEKRYKARLAEAEEKFDEKLAGNSCPRAKIKNFNIVGQVGLGTYSQVYAVRRRKDRTRTVYALMVLPKFRLSALRAAALIREKNFMYAFDCDFITKVHFAFQDARNLYMVMDRALYGNLEACFKQRVPGKTLRFFAAQIILALEYLHACNIVHRALKPRNVLVFQHGCLKLTNFESAKKVRCRTYSLIGTSPFMAPEILAHKGYGKNVDWWALGVLLFEFMYQRHPYGPPGESREPLVQAIGDVALNLPVRTDSESPVCRFLSGLLDKDLSRRLGSLEAGIEDIKGHAWFEEISFFDVLDKSFRCATTFKSVTPKASTRYGFRAKYWDRDLYPARFQGF